MTDELAKGEIERLLRKKVAKQLDDQEYSIETGASYPRTRRGFLEVLEDLEDDDDDDDREGDDDDDLEKQVDHHASTVADLLVEAGSHPDRASTLHYLLRKPGGQALLARLHKAAEQTKEFNMDTLHAIMKDGGIAKTCAAVIAKGSTSFSEFQIVEAASAVAHDRHPELSPAQAFSKVYTAATDEGRVLREAINVAKLSPLTPTMVGGPDAMHEAVDNTESSEAYQQLEAMAAKMRSASPELSAAQAFERVFTDQRYAGLAAKALVRPSATTSYPVPR
jgi:hypothetical protein